ncbi:MAG: zinc ribbon domain-containing protein, partial [Planctomycetaceae bacterium]
MDLPSCPACNQSVLDDDAIHCPFCGASMSGDATSVPVPQHPTPTTTPAQTDSELDKAATDDSPQPTGPTNQLKTAAPPSPDGSDPFAIDPTVSKQAIPAAPKATRKRTWRVHCPMCDTPGFLPRQAAGHDVKCANPECLVPIFTAPASSDETPPPPEPDNPETTNAAGG